MGTLADVDRFDNTYFNVSAKQAHSMDAQVCLSLLCFFFPSPFFLHS